MRTSLLLLFLVGCSGISPEIGRLDASTDSPAAADVTAIEVDQGLKPVGDGGPPDTGEELAALGMAATGAAQH